MPPDPSTKTEQPPGMMEEQLIALELGRALQDEGFAEGLFRARIVRASRKWTCVAGPHGGGFVNHTAMRPYLNALPVLALKMAAGAFSVQWAYVHGNQPAQSVAFFTGKFLQGRPIETRTAVLDSLALRGEFDLSELYRGLF